MKRYFLFALCLLSIISSSLYASKSKPFKSQDEADAYLTEHYNRGCEYYNRESWRRASTEFEKVIYFFPCTDEAATASYYLAVCYFEMKEYDFANEEFSNYLKASQHPEFFEDAVYFKFCIAEYFKAGKKKRPFKMRYLPKWISAQDSALAIYDEVVAALPNHDLTIQALQSKAELLNCMEEYRECIETYQLIIRRFPKHEIIPTCYLKIAETYYQQSRYEFQNPDILALAELNVRKFKDDFPRDERVEIAEQSVCEIKELYAKGLCDLGLFYERMKKPEAAAIYFQSSIEEFPDTRVARFCRSRLNCLGYGKGGINAVPCTDPCMDDVQCQNQQENNLDQDPDNFQGADSIPPPPYESVQSQENVQFANEQSQPYEEPQATSEQMYEQLQAISEQDVSNEPPAPTPTEKAQQPQAIGENFLQRATPVQEDNTPYYLHYSELKHRKQHVAPQE